MTTVLDRIVAAHRAVAAADGRSLDDLVTKAHELQERPRPFRAALAEPPLGIIAEIKRRSPSKGDLAPHLDAEALAKSYEAGGAVALSVLTDSEFFGGSPADLATARASCGLPVLRKDFTVDERDVCDARLMGADAVLLIVAVLFQDELVRLLRLAADLGLGALVEVHSVHEVDRALDAGADLVGVNQRDLRTFEVSRRLASDLAVMLPAGVVKVAESGIHGHDQVIELAAAGYDAVLVGESLVTAPDPTIALKALTGGE